ncbi:MAG: DNA-binding protein [Desulfobacteraceae bacterium]|nr:DNA-binding protein [Desulfobacteraceae bacterium]
MTVPEKSTREGPMVCLKCNLPLQPGKVAISYLGSSFPVDLPKCPGCGQVYVEEALALGKMAEVEKLLEDK